MSKFSTANLIVTFCFSIVVLLVFSSNVYAQSYSVSPLVIDRDFEARESEVVPIVITNNDSRPLRFYVTVNAIKVDESGAVDEFVSPSLVDSKSSVVSWLEISRARIEIPSGQTHTTELKINMPAKVAPGEYHAFIGFPAGSNRPKAEEATLEGNVPGVVVRIGVDDDAFSLLRMSQFYISRFITDTNQQSAVITLVNSGSVDAVPRGEIIFYNTKGVEVDSVMINEDTISIPENGEDSIEVSLPESLSFGKYKAFLNMEYGENQTAQLQDTTFFYVIPLYHLLGLFIFLLVCALILALRIHRQYAQTEEDEFSKVGFVPVNIRSVVSEPKDHDIDLTQSKE